MASNVYCKPAEIPLSFLKFDMKRKQIRLRCWVELDGLKFFGPGPAELLEGIKREGSLAKSAKQMGMSYKKAWDIVQSLNKLTKNKFVESHKGGEEGGRTVLTRHGKNFVSQYRILEKKLNGIVAKEDNLLKLL